MVVTEGRSIVRGPRKALRKTNLNVMQKIPPQADTHHPWTEKDFAEHWTSKGRAMLTCQEWEITLWLSGLPRKITRGAVSTWPLAWV